MCGHDRPANYQPPAGVMYKMSERERQRLQAEQENEQQIVEVGCCSHHYPPVVFDSRNRMGMLQQAIVATECRLCSGISLLYFDCTYAIV